MRFYLYEISQIDKSIEAESSSVVAYGRGAGGRNYRLTTKVSGFLFGVMTCSEMNCGGFPGGSW